MLKVVSFAMPRSGSRAIPYWMGKQFDNQIIIQSFKNFLLTKRLPTGFNDNDIIFMHEYTHLNSYIPKLINILNDNEIRLIYVLRDPWNQISSYIELCYKQKGIALKTVLDRCKVLLNNHKMIIKHILGMKLIFPEESLFLNFNSWFKEEQYRKCIAQQLNLPEWKNEIMNIFHPFGKKYPSHPKKLDVFNRWKAYVDKQYYLDLFNDKELLELVDELYESPF